MSHTMLMTAMGCSPHSFEPDALHTLSITSKHMKERVDDMWIVRSNAWKKRDESSCDCLAFIYGNSFHPYGEITHFKKQCITFNKLQPIIKNRSEIDWVPSVHCGRVRYYHKLILRDYLYLKHGGPHVLYRMHTRQAYCDLTRKHDDHTRYKDRQNKLRQLLTARVKPDNFIVVDWMLIHVPLSLWAHDYLRNGRVSQTILSQRITLILHFLIELSNLGLNCTDFIPSAITCFLRDVKPHTCTLSARCCARMHNLIHPNPSASIRT